ncbi:DUF2232 domain-containing protein [Paenibacillus sp. TCA20]|uniref:DUF2232 domain-containing protein n=1 Tax=Paenibacillus TaxID=44249 RepID=UPI001EE656D8|nr:DUF2232 domain-containing protein [Paenibacillus sp. TCA20]
MNILKFRWKTAVWSLIYLLLLLSLLTPLTAISVFLIILPGVILYTSLNLKSFLVHVIPVLLIGLIISPIYLIFGIFFLIPAIVIGHCYKKQKPALNTLVLGTGTILAEFLLLLLISTTLFQIDFSEYIRETIEFTMTPVTESGGNNALTNGLVMDEEMAEAVSSATVQMIPFALIVTSLVMASLTHVIARPILGRMGIRVNRLKPIREWRLPKSLIWYYFLGIILQLVAGNTDNGFLTMIALNFSPLINFCFMIQAIGFFFFAAHARSWHPVIPYLLAVATFLIGPMRIIGIIDLAFPLREAISKPKR